MPNPKEAGKFEVEPVYTQNTSKVGIWAIPKLSQFGDRKLLKY
jgi:hypothetical protein